MSTLIAEPIVEVASQPTTETPTRPFVHERPASTPRYVRQPAGRPQGRAVSKKRTRLTPATLFVVRVTAFVAISGFTWASSGLVGEVMVERVHAEEVRAHTRSVLAQRSLSALRDRVNRLTDDRNIVRWALSHEMVLPEPTRVAKGEPNAKDVAAD